MELEWVVDLGDELPDHECESARWEWERHFVKVAGAAYSLEGIQQSSHLAATSAVLDGH